MEGSGLNRKICPEDSDYTSDRDQDGSANPHILDKYKEAPCLKTISFVL